MDQVLPDASLPRLAVLTGFLAVLAIASSLFQAVQGLTVLRIEGRMCSALAPAVWERLLRLPTRFFAEFSAGDLALRSISVGEVFKKLSGTVVATIVTGIFSVFNVGLLYYYSWKLAACATMLLVGMMIVTAVLLAQLVVHESSVRRIDGVISGLLLEMFGGIATLRTFGAEGRTFARWAWRYADRLTSAIRPRRVANQVHQWLAVCPIIAAMVIYAGAVHIDPELMKTGMFLGFMITLGNLMTSVLAVGRAVGRVA